ncbi:Ca2+-transporting ATPase [Sphaerotilus hippei]|uniref:Ca2+-transporting ATPase n=1 Tax=Sphaerotilus hippei TaxID=744406 RepID=A0A318H554_9BURK|nr:cation-translocating P-type ATPase [Sphaerotilus hippei]PXW98840.1 Ca2+-transporting ATPase [Sphaerotilus hippei]
MVEPHRAHAEIHERAHLLSVEAVAAGLGVDPGTGLRPAEHEERLARHGPNALPTARPRSLPARLLEPFLDVMVLVLLAAAGVAFALGERTDAVVILVIVVLNALIGLVQEWKADRALLALQQLAAPQACVRRDGQPQQVQAHDLVPGDLVLLEAGNLVPADLRLSSVAQLRVDESTLTGESVTVDKHAQALSPPPGSDGASLALGDRLNMAFKGTMITHGRAEGLVVATGAGTQLGQVASLLGSSGRRSTPLQRRLAAFGRRLSVVVLGICVVVFFTGVLLRDESPWTMALTAISLAVAAIPEALPAVVTVLLALGARRMVQGQALVRRLPAVETLGSVSTICSDKTGTLTLNRMQVSAALTSLDEAPASRTADAALWRAAVLCNDAQPAPHRRAGAERWSEHTPSAWIGDPTETALLDGAAARDLPIEPLRARLPRAHEWPFDADRKRMSTLHRTGHGWLALTKGAPEAVLPRCIATDTGGEVELQAWLERARQLAGQGLRVLALAQRRHEADRHPQDESADQAERQLELLGLIALIDPPRPEARAAVAECLAAGITPVMITGDHPATALAIAAQLGLLDPGQQPPQVLTGADLGRMDEAELGARVEDVRVYARVDPAQKIRIVQALQARGRHVAMTGDGVNDAPALKAADIGVAMGRNGTDVAREAASLVLLDDHFATIVTAVREGRRIFDNIRKFIRYAMTGNSGEIWTIFLAPLLGLPIPLLPIHILWINLVTDGLPGLALAAEAAEPGVMRRPPRPPGESLFAHGLWQHALWVGLLIAALCLGVHAWAIHDGQAHGQTMVFTVLTLAQMAHVLAIRSESVPMWRLGWRSNLPLHGAVALTFVMQMATLYVPWLQDIFHTEALSAAELLICLGCAATVAVAVEAEKAWRRR